jgi:hypothetical protein
VFVDMIGYLSRYRDVDLMLGEVDVAALREFFRAYELHVDEDSSRSHH